MSGHYNRFKNSENPFESPSYKDEHNSWTLRKRSKNRIYNVFTIISATLLSTATLVGTIYLSQPSKIQNSSLSENQIMIPLHGFTNTQTWQGYYGNVTGTIELGDSSDNALHDWSKNASSLEKKTQ